MISIQANLLGSGEASSWSPTDLVCSPQQQKVKKTMSRVPSHHVLNWKLLIQSVVCTLGMSSVASATIEFEDISTSANLLRAGESYGAAWGDLNGDSYPDLFVSNHRNRSSFYVNRGNGKFLDIGTQFKTFVNKPRADTHGASFVDFDNDGDTDLFVATGSGNPNQLIANENGDLIDRTLELGITFEQVGGRQGVWFDYNADKRMDLFMVNRSGTARVLEQLNTGKFMTKSATVGVNCTKFHYAQLFDLYSDGRLALLCGTQEQNGNVVYPQAAYDTSTMPFTDIKSNFPPVAQAIDTAVGDFNGDLQLDMFHVRGVLRPSGVAQQGNTVEALLIGGKKGVKFRSTGVLNVEVHWNQNDEVSGMPDIKIGASGYSPGASTFTLDPSDPNVAGTPTYDTTEVPLITVSYVPSTNEWWFVNVSGSSFSNAYFIINSTNTVTSLKATGLWAGDKPMSPTLMLNTGASMTDGTVAAGLDAPAHCISTVAGDFDNDTDVDIYAACRGAADNIANKLFENQGNGTFAPVANAGGAQGPLGLAVTSGAGTADSVIAADYDLDGFLDLFLTNGFNMRPLDTGGPDQLFRNKGNGNHWIQLDLRASDSVNDSLGARVIATTPNGKSQLRESDGAYHRWSQNNQRLHFGLGGATQVDLRVEWPSGTVELFSDVTADRVYRITEGTGIAVVNAGATTQPFPCGAPPYSAANDTGIYLWKDCPSQKWKVRAVAAAASALYTGIVTSNATFATVQAQGLEANDELDYTTNPEQIRFVMNTPRGTQDGFDFKLGTGATATCLSINLPEGQKVYYGPLATPLDTPIDVQTMQPCAESTPVASVSDVMVSEAASSAQVVVSLNRAAPEPVQVTLTTADETATAGDDYTATTRLVQFASGESSTSVNIPLLGDALSEGNETFTATLSDPVGAVISATQRIAVVTITDDEISACGAPSYTPGTDRGVFLWQDCGTNTWYARVVTDGTTLTFAGEVASNADLVSVTPKSVESNDIFDYTTDPSTISFALKVSTVYYDGFDFTTAAGAQTCFNLTGPAGANVYVGSGRNVVSTPFNLATLQPCS